MTQKDRVLNYIMEHGSISQAEADTIKVKRLASRIHEMIKEGKPIKSETVYGKNEYGKYHYSRYSLEV